LNVRLGGISVLDLGYPYLSVVLMQEYLVCYPEMTLVYDAFELKK